MVLMLVRIASRRLEMEWTSKMCSDFFLSSGGKTHFPRMGVWEFGVYRMEKVAWAFEDAENLLKASRMAAFRNERRP